MLTNLKWPMESASTRMPDAPKRDGITPNGIDRLGLAEVAGMLLESVPATAPASSLPPDEYEARIAAHAARIAKEEAALRQRKAVVDGPPKARDRGSKLPGRLHRADVRVVNCARCQRPLLGESQEILRLAHADSPLAKNFPPPVAARLHGGRPYCATCATYYDSPVS